jgi:hypothetical protein
MVFHRKANEFCSVVAFGFSEQAADVLFDGSGAEVEPIAYLNIRKTFCQQI